MYVIYIYNNQMKLKNYKHFQFFSSHFFRDLLKISFKSSKLFTLILMVLET